MLSLSDRRNIFAADGAFVLWSNPIPANGLRGVIITKVAFD